ncbi:MAG: RNA polymerase sigma factor [Proteobacteria bacterium]|nr:RNA polymerase sigma factor [Pseudomonadota bacterium]
MINKVYIEYLLLKDNKESLQQVLCIIQPKLLSFAKNLLKDNHNAQDALQDSLIAIIKGVRKLKDHRKFHAWIYQVTRNKCLDIIRKNQKYKNDSELDSIPEPTANEKDVDKQIDMMSMINQLPHNQKNVIHLFYYDGFNIIEIASILNKPAGTIKSLLFDARATLKHLLGE